MLKYEKKLKIKESKRLELEKSAEKRGSIEKEKRDK
jgi:hypothetical protein